MHYYIMTARIRYIRKTISYNKGTSVFADPQKKGQKQGGESYFPVLLLSLPSIQIPSVSLA
ncbi:hypothetical protein K160097B7_03910 [[Clostridium] hylemonae]